MYQASSAVWNLPYHSLVFVVLRFGICRTIAWYSSYYSGIFLVPYAGTSRSILGCFPYPGGRVVVRQALPSPFLVLLFLLRCCLVPFVGLPCFSLQGCPVPFAALLRFSLIGLYRSPLQDCSLLFCKILLFLFTRFSSLYSIYYPKMYRVSENGHPAFLPLCFLSAVYVFGTDFASRSVMIFPVSVFTVGRKGRAGENLILIVITIWIEKFRKRFVTRNVIRKSSAMAVWLWRVSSLSACSFH